MKPLLFSAVLAALFVTAASAQERSAPPPELTGAIALGVKGKAPPNAEIWSGAKGQRGVRNVTNPTLTPVLPDPAKATGAAVIIAPGGGFIALGMDSEGFEVAHWLADRGVAAFVLKYRLKPTPADSAGMAAYVSEMTKAFTTPGAPRPVLATPSYTLEDAENAVRLVRRRAAEWGVDPHRVGFIGFSAGALTTMSVGLTPNKDARPDFIGPIYGSMERTEVPKDAPPLFAALAADDRLFGQSDLGLISAWREAGRPFELHFYEHGGHGFGMRKQGTTSDLWIEEFYAWMKARGLLNRSN